MNRKSIVTLSAVLAFAFAASANACDKKCGTKKDAKTVATATTVSSPDAPKCPHAAKTGASSDCSKCPYANKTAKTVATGSKPCCGNKGKSAKTVATASKPCCAGKSAKTAKTVATGKSGCSKSRAARTAGTESNNGRAAAVLASMPAMSYHAGEYTGSCFHSATAKAKAAKATVTFIVDGKDYESRGDANIALASLLTDRANEMAEVKLTVGDQTFTCPHAAQGVADKSNTKIGYQLAGFNFSDKDQADKLSAKLRETISTAAATVKADGKSVGCAKSARAAGKTVTYVVGDEATSCEKQAKLLVAQRLVRTIVETAASSL